MMYFKIFLIIIIGYSIIFSQTNIPQGITGKISKSDLEKTDNKVATLAVPELIYPADNATNIPIVPKFIIGTLPQADRYELELIYYNFIYYPVSTSYWQFDEPLSIDSLEWFPAIEDAYYIKNNAIYFWRVRALANNQTQTSEWSEYYQYTTASSNGSSLAKPNLISPLNNNNVFWQNVPLIWEEINNSTWYQVQWSTNFLTNGFSYHWSPGEIPEYTTNLSPSNQYSWKVIAFNNNTISQFSNYGYFQTRNEILYSGFKLNVDGYSFNNTTTLAYFTSGWDDIYRDYKSELSYILPFLKLLGRILFTGKGNCYGMSASSIMYFHYGYLIPSPYSYTHQIELSSQAATDNIAYYQRIQIPNIFTHFLDRLIFNSEKEKYQKIVDKISENHPLLVDLIAYKNGKKSEGHAIVAYKVREYADSSHIFVYDVNAHDDTTRYITYINEEGNERFNAYHNYTKINFYDPDDDIMPIPQFVETLKEEGRSYFIDLINNSKNLFTFFSSPNGNYALNKKQLSNGDLYIEDQSGNKIGYYNGNFLNQIPGAEIIDSINLTLELANNLNYTLHFSSSDNNTIDFAGLVSNINSQNANSFSFDSIALSPSSTLTEEFNSSGIGAANIDLNGDGIIDTVIQPTSNLIVSTKEYRPNIPSNFYLSQNYPNPFNPSTTINYSIPQSSFVTLKVYDILGKEIATLVNEEKRPGNYSVQFSASNYNLSNGVYFYRLQAGNFSKTKKLVLLK